MAAIMSYLLNIKKSWLTIVYFLLIFLLLPPQYSWSKKLLLLVYAATIFWMVEFVLQKKELSDKNRSWHENRLFIYVLLFSTLFLLITRLIPFYNYGEAPLGYDTGFYLRNFGINDFSLLSSTAYNLNLVPYHVSGMSPLLALSFIYVLSQLMIAGSLYFLFRSINIKSSLAFAAIAIFLFVMSVTQFYAYWWMLGQQMLAMAIVFISIALLFRKPYLALLTGSFSLLLHVPTFAVFALSFLLFFIIKIILTIIRREPFSKKILIVFLLGLGMATVGLVMRYSEFVYYFREYIILHRGLPSTFSFWDIPRLKGAFLDVTKLRLTSMLILPLTIYAFFRPQVWKKAFNFQQSLSDFVFFLYIMFICLLALVVFPVIYQQRFMIIFDFLLIIFATPVLVLLIQYFSKSKLTKLLMTALLIVFFFEISSIAWNQTPHIDPAELAEIKKLSAIAEGNSIVLATNSVYTPWIYGFSGRNSYGPGTAPDPWNFDQWIKFWTTGADEERLAMLKESYPSWVPLYLFIGQRQEQGLAYVKFVKTDPHFSKISDHVWKFNPAYEKNDN